MTLDEMRPVPQPNRPNPGIPENQVPLLYDGPWLATIEKTGRWTYTIRYRRDGMEEQPYRYAIGRTHADNKARRELNRRNRLGASETWTVGNQP